MTTLNHDEAVALLWHYLDCGGDAAIRALLEENKWLNALLEDRGEDCDLCGEILGDAACEKCVGKLEACIDAALALKMPQPTHEDDDERAVYEHGWNDCMGATVKALRGVQPEEKPKRVLDSEGCAFDSWPEWKKKDARAFVQNELQREGMKP